MDPERDEERWLPLAQSISTGEAVDWDELEQQAIDKEESSVVRALRALDGIARVHRSSTTTRSDRAGQASRPSTAVQRWRHLAILECVGQGTFGTVYRAREEGLDREVALKLLWPAGNVPSGAPSSIVREARLLARVRHPNVVAIYGAESIDGQVGLWMEFIKGRTLEDLLTAQGPFGAPEAAAIGLDLCRALSAVHGAHLLHRDVKCRNVMREAGGRIVLMDFGASADLSAEHRDPREEVAGTPVYLAPELFEGQPPSVAADVYSLGVLLYHLVTGAYPVTGQTKDDIRRAHGRRERQHLRDVRADLPDAFVRVVERALAWDPADRWQTAGAFAEALSASMGFTHVSPGGRESIEDRPAIAVPVWRRHRWSLAAGLILLVSLGGGAAWWKLTSESAGGAPASFSRGVVNVTRVGAADSSPYEIGATFHAAKNGTEARLRSGARLSPGDKLFLTLRSSTAAYVYVVNQDEQGEAYLLFPLPGQSVTNPLPSNAVTRLPGTWNGQEYFWQVTSVGGREHFFIFASPQPLEQFERTVAALPRPEIDKPVISLPLTKEALGTLRGVGGLSRPDAPATVPLAFPFARPLLETPETTSGFWAREIVFDNPRTDR